VRFLNEVGIVPVAYCPFARPGVNDKYNEGDFVYNSVPTLSDEPILKALADKYKKGIY
jgi:hypothetical protein